MQRSFRSFATIRSFAAKWAPRVYRMFADTLAGYSKDRVELAAAGLAFFTLLSMAPLMLVAVAIAGAVLGSGPAREAALSFVRDTMGGVAEQTVRGWLEQAAASGGVASLVGFVLVLYAASRLTVQLRVALNQVWNVDREAASNLKLSVRDFIQRKLFAFALVLASGPLLLAIFLSRALLTGLHQTVLNRLPMADSLVQLSQVGFSLSAVAAISALAFKLLPDAPVPWRAVLIGAPVTSVLFNAGNGLVGLYLGRASVTHTYGAAGALMVVLIWLYFSAQMFLIGAEFTQVCAHRVASGWRVDQPRSREPAETPRGSDVC